MTSAGKLDAGQVKGMLVGIDAAVRNQISVGMSFGVCSRRPPVLFLVLPGYPQAG